jgi:hypothetical protein
MNDIKILHKIYYQTYVSWRKADKLCPINATKSAAGRLCRMSVVAVALVSLSACGEVPIQKTNCWTAAASSDIAARASVALLSFSFAASVPGEADETACE